VRQSGERKALRADCSAGSVIVLDLWETIRDEIQAQFGGETYVPFEVDISPTIVAGACCGSHDEGVNGKKAEGCWMEASSKRAFILRLAAPN